MAKDAQESRFQQNAIEEDISFAQCTRPEHLREYRGPSGKEGIDLDDVSWIGADGKLDPEEVLRKHGFDPEPPLEPILLAIIDAHPSSNGEDRSERLERALSALHGTPRKRGNDEMGDYELLLKIANQFRREFLRTRKEPDVQPLARNVIESLDIKDVRRCHSDDSAVRRLCRKFNAKKELLLVRSSSMNDWNRMDTRRAIAGVLKSIRALGINVADPWAGSAVKREP